MRKLVIPLGQEHRLGAPGWPEKEAACDRIIGQHLANAAREGWEPESPTDFRTLYYLGRVKVTSTAVDRLRGGHVAWKYVAVTVRVRRIVG